jgi:Protein of unknown function (DUF3592)
VKVNVSVRSRTTRTLAIRQSPLIFIAAIFFGLGVPLFLWYQVGFAVYAATAFSWVHTNGTVTSSHTTDVPMIQFTLRDGSLMTFKEDYFMMCHRSFCLVRHFDPGQTVPVVYDPDTPMRAYVYDWALFANTIEWFVMAGIFLLFVLLIVGVRLRTSRTRFSVRIGQGPDAD